MVKASAGATAYAQKKIEYFAGGRQDFVSMLPLCAEAAVLEVGCGIGTTGRLALEQGRCKRFCGVELLPSAAREAASCLTEVVQGDIEKLDLPWAPGVFSAVILSEVLEHLQDPWMVLRKLRVVLKDGGLVLASSPNVSHLSVIAMAIRGRWDLTDAGPMDRTHLRWFTPGSYAEMFEQEGFSVISNGPLRPLSRKAKLLTWPLRGWGWWLFARQIVLVAQKLVDEPRDGVTERMQTAASL
jgi:2-polyprenyl-3-methyl-5-hydroxy-6-metoxy-1,4-benzoquinol methylase